MPKEVDPRQLFDRLFREGEEDEAPEERAARLARRRSVLDLARADARRLAQTLGADDRRKLDEYETSVRELERDWRAPQTAPAMRPIPRPAAGVPKDRGEHARLLSTCSLALRTDSTRIATFGLGNEGSNASHVSIGVPEGHHETSHHGGDAAKREKIARIDRFHMECLAHSSAGWPRRTNAASGC